MPDSWLTLNCPNATVGLQAAAGSASSGHELCLARYAACVKACDEHLCADAPAGSPAERPPPLFEGQLSQVRSHIFLSFISSFAVVPQACLCRFRISASDSCLTATQCRLRAAALQEADLPPQRRGLEELLALAALRFPAAPEEYPGSAGGGAEPAGAAPAPLPPADLDAALQRGAGAALADIVCCLALSERVVNKCCVQASVPVQACYGILSARTVPLAGMRSCQRRCLGCLYCQSCSCLKGDAVGVWPELEEAIAASLADAEAGGARPGGPPPAAAYAVRALRTEALTAERLAALGGPGVECCVCRRGPRARTIL